MSPGDSVPADMILLSGRFVECDESSTTGLKVIVEKTPLADDFENLESNPDPFLFASSLITKGEGFAIVAAVGPST